MQVLGETTKVPALFQKLSGFKKMLISTTIALAATKSYQSVSVDLVDFSDYFIECDRGVISSNLNYTKFGLVAKWRTDSNVLINFDTGCTNWVDFYSDIHECEGEKTCELNYRGNWVKGGCNINPSNDIGYLRVFCKGKIACNS